MDMRTLKILVSDGDCVLHGEWGDVCEMIFSFPECGSEEEFRGFLREKGFEVEDKFWADPDDRGDETRWADGESETSKAVRESANRELENREIDAAVDRGIAKTRARFGDDDLC